MKLLVIANHLLSPEISSGGDRFSADMVKRWKAFGADVTVMASKGCIDIFAKEVDADNTIPLSTTLFDNLARKNIFYIPFAYFFRLIKSLGVNYPSDIIYTTGDFFCDVIPAFIYRKSFKAKWVANIYHINDSPFKRKGNSLISSVISYGLQRFSFLFLKSSADIIFLNNDLVKAGLIDTGFDPKRLVVLGLGGVDFGKIRSDCGTKKYDACFVGRLNPTKGIFDLPKIWAGVVDKFPQAQLLIIGGGEEWRDQLVADFKNLNLEKNVTLLGFVSEEDKYNSLAQSKVFVFPSYEEGWGMVVAEALASKLPVIAYDLPVYQEVFPDVLSKTKIGDTEQMSQEINNLLSNQKLYEERSQLGYSFVQRYNLDELARNQWSIIQDLQNGKR